MTGAGFGATSGASPKLPISLLVGPGDSILEGFGLAPATLNWGTQSCADVVSGGGQCTVASNIAFSGAASWQWYPWTPPAIVGGKSNVALISLGSNDFGLANSNNGSEWFAGETFPANGTGHLIATLGHNITVTVGNPTVFTFTYNFTGRSTSDWIECFGTGLVQIDFVPLQPSAVGTNTMTFPISTSGSPSQAACYLQYDNTVENYAVFRADVGGTTGAQLPPWSLSGSTTDGAVTWNLIPKASLTAQILTDLETNVLYLADQAHNAGYSVVLGEVIPRSAGTVIPITGALFQTMRTSFATWAPAQIGTHGIKSVALFSTDAIFGTSGQSSCGTFPTYWQDCIHPTALGAAYMATNFGAAALLAAQ